MTKFRLLLIAFFMTTGSLLAQSGEDVHKLIREKDRNFWIAYNSCDMDRMRNFLAEDLEFYHDKGGITKTLASLEKGTKNGLCKTGDNILVRKEVAGSVEIFPLYKNSNELYGAIISGEHLFFLKEQSLTEPDGQAKFNHLWLLQDGDWKMHRILSYDHRPAEKTNHQ